MKAWGQILRIAAFSFSLMSCAPEEEPAKPTLENWRFTVEDISLLSELHARPYRYNKVGDDGRRVEFLDADDLFDDRGMKLVAAKMPNLRSLSLMLCPGVTDRGLEGFQALNQLKSLRLHYASVTDSGIERILGMTQLEELDLSGTQTTTAGLLRLRELEHLEVIVLEEKSFSKDEIATLESAFGDTLNLH